MKNGSYLKHIVFCFFYLVIINAIEAQSTAEIQNSREKILATTAIFHLSHEVKKKNVPFSDIVEVGDLFFLSGQIGMDHSSRRVVEGGIAAETKQALENIKAVLEVHGLQLTQVVKCTVVLADIEDFKEFNAIYRDYFPQKPARTTFAASGLAKGAKIEIECIAAR